MKWMKRTPAPAAQAVQTAPAGTPFSALGGYVPLGPGERRLYDALREAVPVIDAAIDKIIRLTGGFTVRCEAAAQKELEEFLRNVPVNSTGTGIQSFLNGYLSQLLTYGNAVGEMVPGGGTVAALYNAALDDVELRQETPLKTAVYRKEAVGSVKIRYPELVVCSALNPPPGSAQGVSLLRGLPFVSGILVQIYNTIGVNWERTGNVRFAVTYKPGNDAGDRAYAKERAQQIASEWGRAMRKDTVSDFVAVGDVNIRAIGADSQLLDSEIPVRQMLEQIVAKLGLPPFLLGLSWSSTERMSSQQADILTSELEAYRRLLTPVVVKICSTWLALHGCDRRCAVEWDNITLQDETELANARLLNARAAQMEAALQNGKDG